jgi:hypothetical protein
LDPPRAEPSTLDHGTGIREMGEGTTTAHGIVPAVGPRKEMIMSPSRRLSVGSLAMGIALAAVACSNASADDAASGDGSAFSSSAPATADDLAGEWEIDKHSTFLQDTLELFLGGTWAGSTTAAGPTLVEDNGTWTIEPGSDADGTQTLSLTDTRDGAPQTLRFTLARATLFSRDRLTVFTAGTVRSTYTRKAPGRRPPSSAK